MNLPRDTTPDPVEARRRQQQDPLLSSVVRAADAAHDSDCPDAEWLALYADQALTAAEVAVAAPHLQSCARCEEIVAAYRRASADAPADADLLVIPAAADAGGLGGWLAGWRWLVPATSLVAMMVVAVWIGREPADQVAESAGTAPSAPAVDAFARAAPGDSERASEAAAAPSADQRRQQASRQLVPDRMQSPAVSPRTSARSLGVAAETQPARNAAAQAKATASSADADAGVPAEASRSDSARVAGEAAPTERLEAAVAPPPAATTVPAPPAAADGRAAPGARVSANDDPTFRSEISAPSWRASRGVIERSGDKGLTWARVAAPAGVVIVAVAPVSADVCWGLSADSVFRVTDGASWIRTARPPTGPLTSIRATSARDATVAAGGVRFATTDGGLTWQLVR